MLISGTDSNMYIYYEKRFLPVYYEVKTQNEKQTDTFEKRREPYSVENSIEDFAFNLAILIKNEKCDKDNVRQLIRKYVPRTKIEDNWLNLALSGSSARFDYKSQISSNDKMHYPRKKIIVNMNEKENNMNELFNSLVHEMIHNLQLNKERKIMNTVYNDYFEDSLYVHWACNNLFDKGMKHGSQRISENFNNTFGVLKFLERENYSAVKNRNVDKFVDNPEKRKELEQIYDLGVLTVLAQEEEAYTTADSLEYKYFNTKNPRAKKNERLFKTLKEVAVDDLKKTGMSEEKIAEYKELIGW